MNKDNIVFKEVELTVYRVVPDCEITNYFRVCKNFFDAIDFVRFVKDKKVSKKYYMRCRIFLNINGEEIIVEPEEKNIIYRLSQEYDFNKFLDELDKFNYGKLGNRKEKIIERIKILEEYK